MTAPAFTRWAGRSLPAEEELERRLRLEGLAPRWWSNGPGDRYGAHSHPYHKVLYCARGSISFALDSGERVELGPGDRLDLPPRVAHSAIVGPSGVSCVEAGRS
jgi:hypothetical protein